MPYNTNADLPDKVKKNLSAHQQTIFRKTFNSALKQYNDETKAFKVAWSAAKKSNQSGEINLYEKVTFNLSVPLLISESVGNKLAVGGLAVSEITSYNGITYVEEELIKAAKSMKGIPILKDHKVEIESIVGRVEEASYNYSQKGIVFKGNIMDEKIKEMLQDGRISHVSIGAMAKIEEVELKDGNYAHVARDIKIVELSLTPVPGVETASIACAISESLNLQTQETKEELNMKKEDNLENSKIDENKEEKKEDVKENDFTEMLVEINKRLSAIEEKLKEKEKEPEKTEESTESEEEEDEAKEDKDKEEVAESAEKEEDEDEEVEEKATIRNTQEQSELNESEDDLVVEHYGGNKYGFYRESKWRN